MRPSRSVVNRQPVWGSAPNAAIIARIAGHLIVRDAGVLLVSRACGIIALVAAQRGLAFAEYTPLQVKQAIVGYGRAEKRQVQEMVRLMLRMPEIPRPDDAADALAVAICHLHSRRVARRLA